MGGETRAENMRSGLIIPGLRNQTKAITFDITGKKSGGLLRSFKCGGCTLSFRLSQQFWRATWGYPDEQLRGSELR